MEISYYKSKIGNIGDDLNPILLQRIFGGNVVGQHDDLVALFIGTILFDGFEGNEIIDRFKEKRKLIIGAGVRYVNNPISLDDSYDLRFVRGPYSSLALTNTTDFYITDPACLVVDFIKLNGRKKSKPVIGLMPHFKSLDKVDWSRLCKKMNLVFISPSTINQTVELTLKKIADCDLLITEAMHGAILADSLRVPWKRIRFFSYLYEDSAVAEFKWADWAASMNVTFDTFDLNYPGYIKILERKFQLGMLKRIRENFVYSQISEVVNFSGVSLSEDGLLKEKVELLKDALSQVKSDYDI